MYRRDKLINGKWHTKSHPRGVYKLMVGMMLENKLNEEVYVISVIDFKEKLIDFGKLCREMNNHDVSGLADAYVVYDKIKDI